MVKQEWKNLFDNKILLISTIIMMFIPIIYAGVILSSYWDPYGKTDHLPVAVVNNDQPTDFEGKTLNVGEELIENLKTNHDLAWHFVSSEIAKKGFVDGDYYMVITIPKDFSKSASTVLDKTPSKMNLSYEVNQGRNFFIGTVGKQATKNINQQISASVTKEYTKAIFSKMSEMGKGFSGAANGASQIDHGVAQVKQGNEQITENLNKLASTTLIFTDGADKIKVGVGDFLTGAKELNVGASRLNEGITQYTNGISLLQEKTSLLVDQENGVPKLAAGQRALNEAMKELSSGSTMINAGIKQMDSKLPSQIEVNQLSQGLSNIQTAVNELQKVISQSGLSPQLMEQVNALNNAVNIVQPKAIEAIGGYTTLRNSLESQSGLIRGTSQLAAGLNQAVSGSNELTSATTNLNNQLPQLGSAINQLATKSTDLKNGSFALVQGTELLSNKLPELQTGVIQLADGAGLISKGSGELANGSAQLGDGIATLKSGTNELAGKLTEGADTVNSIKTTDENYDMIASPMTVKEEKANEVPNYGHALAPNFLSIGLYIGALAFCVIFPINMAATKPTSGREWWFSKFSIGFIQSVAGALILDAIIILGIGLHVENVVEFILISILTSLTYMFMIMLLGITFGNPGRFIAMIFFVLQLASSGGMFPVELQNGFFHALNPYMPMTYVIYGFREAMSSALGNGIFTTSVAILVGCIIVFNLLLLLVLNIRKQRQFDLVPES
jgi:putative membrane protein